jgi:predicted Zn-dependent protease with MMP-like domain
VPFHVSKTRFDELVRLAVEELPEEFARFVEEVPIDIRDRPTPAQLADARVPLRGLLLGLYHGRPRTARSVEDSGTMPDVIFIFQQSIEQICRDEAELIHQVRKTVLHEIGHHFGMNEEDLRRLGYA